MSDRMHPLDPVFLLSLLLKERDTGLVPGLPPALRFTPSPDDPFRMERHGRVLETPLGAASGPHTQMCQNIVTAWLAGARFLELKTVQARDDIRVAKPCIDMRDEGYNCEWSQELTLAESYREYLHAYVLIHVLRHAFRHPVTAGGPGFLFDMSVGYDLDGIRGPGVSGFLNAMADASADIDALRRRLASVYPAAADLPIEPRIADSVTISTMHGCPSEETERIARHLMQDRGLHVTIKLNPTLLGPDKTRAILSEQLGYTAQIPDEIFSNDLAYDDALELIWNLRRSAAKHGRDFHVKLTNTLGLLNTHTALPPAERMVYLSGRALHPLTTALAAQLQESFRGDLTITFSGGLDSWNVADCLACGLAPLTFCSDLLKPGGYARLSAALASIRAAMKERGALSLRDLAGRAGPGTVWSRQLAAYAEECAKPSGRYAKAARASVKPFARDLPRYDCAAAPCQAVCPSDQRQPAYLGEYGQGQGANARRALVYDNPLHHGQAAFCDFLCRHKCEKACLRGHRDRSVRIQAVRSFVQAEAMPAPAPRRKNRETALIRGDGVAGLTCAFRLNRMGLSVLVEASAPAAREQLALSLGPELAAALGDDRSALAHKGVEFSDAPVMLQTPLPPGVAIYETADISASAIPASLSASRNPDAPAPLIIQGAAATTSPAALRAAFREGNDAAEAILAAFGLERPSLLWRDPAEARLRRRGPAVNNGPQNVQTAAQARAEAERCLQCDLTCGICVEVCPNRANFALPSPKREVPILLVRPDRWEIAYSFACREPVQILNLADLCNECGNCATFCPSREAPFRIKPRLHLNAASYEEEGAGYYWPDQDTLLGKDAGVERRLERRGDVLAYSEPAAGAEFAWPSLEPLDARLAEGEEPLLLDRAADMLMMWQMMEGGMA